MGLSLAAGNRLFAAVRGLGRQRLAFLGYVSGGHTVIHWYQQLFSVVLPSLSQGLGLSEIQVGYLQSARQLTSGTLNLPVGMLADAFAHRQALILGSAILFMGIGYFSLGAASGLAGALLGSAGRHRHRGLASAGHGGPVGPLPRSPGHGARHPRDGGHGR